MGWNNPCHDSWTRTTLLWHGWNYRMSFSIQIEETHWPARSNSGRWRRLMGRFTAERCLPILVEHLNNAVLQYWYNHWYYAITARDVWWNITITATATMVILWSHVQVHRCWGMPSGITPQCWYITILQYFSTGNTLTTWASLLVLLICHATTSTVGTTAVHCYKDCNWYFRDHFYCWYNYWFHCDHACASSQLRDAKVGMPSGHYHPMCNHRARESQLLVTCQSQWPVAML